MVATPAVVNLKRTDPLLRLNAVCPYYTMFPLWFPLAHLQGARPGDGVLDPFCGRGTTSFAARLLGLPSVGLDSNPVAVAVAAAKLVRVTPQEIVDEAAEILGHGPAPEEVPTGPFWELAYHPKTLEEICRLREVLRWNPPLPEGNRFLVWPSGEPPARTALRAVMLGILHGPRNRRPSYLSNQMPRTYATKPEPAVRFWQDRALVPEYVDTLDLIQRRARFTFAQVPDAVPGAVFLADSREPDVYRAVPYGPFQWVITSPPYFGMRFYKSDQWLRYWFLGGPPAVPYGLEGQMGAGRTDSYMEDLAQVWRLAAEASEVGARLVVRVGALPSLARDPEALLLASLEMAGGVWKVLSVAPAGRPPRHRRQAEQFVKPGRGPEEIDVVAVRE